MLKKAEENEMPALLFMGEHEMLRLLPLWNEPTPEIRYGVIPLESTDKKNAFNNWRRVAGCAPYVFSDDPDTYKRHSDPVVRSIGAEFERTEIREYNDRKYFIGDSLNRNGECLFRTVACEGMVHWPTTVFAELVWEHISRFKRDMNTGKCIRL